METKAIKDLKKGEFFTLKNYGEYPPEIAYMCAAIMTEAVKNIPAINQKIIITKVFLMVTKLCLLALHTKAERTASNERIYLLYDRRKHKLPQKRTC